MSTNKNVYNSYKNNNGTTECRCRVVKTPASNYAEPGFKSRQGDRLFRLKIFRASPSGHILE